MKVKDLKAALFYLPDDMEILLARDEEGNGFYRLQEADGDAKYIKSDDWELEVVHQDDWPEYLDELESCVVLWP